MLPSLIIIVVVAAILLASAYKRRQNLKKRLEKIRMQWGNPIDDVRYFNLIEAYYRNAYHTNASTDAMTADLDLDKVFAFADRTVSKPGQQFLYAKLRFPAKAAEELQLQEAYTEKLTADDKLREQVQLELARLESRDAYYLNELFTKIHEPLYSPVLSLYIKFAHAVWVATLTLTIVLHNQFLFILALGLTLFNSYIHFTNKNKIRHYVHSMPQLKMLLLVVQNISRMVNLPINAKAATALDELKTVKRSLNWVSLEGQMINDPTDLAYGIWELFKMLLLVEPRIFINSVKGISTHRTAIKQLFDYAGKVDTAISVQSFRLSLPWYSKPNFTDNNELKFTEIYHPLVEDCVPNSLVTRADQGVLITGSNMSGKTTFIRSVAINSLLAQTINTVCAQSYTAPLMQVCTSIRVSDDLEEHRSYFQAEALSVLEIMKKSESSKCLVIIDEIFRGTNTIERVAAAKAILSYLTAKRNFVFISTHDLELAELLGDDYAVYSFEETVADTRLVFDYKIKPGILKNKNAIAILEAAGYPASVVSDAYQMSEQLRDKYKL